MTENARLVILKELAKQQDGRLNDAVLVKVLDVFGHYRSREWVAEQLDWLAQKGAVEMSRAGTALVARITRTGADHVERRAFIAGIDKPSFGV
ncbi:MAG: hypothetical protein J0I64_10445 [Devosia sp.]|nr:hypothetical protein [Devosia sp.]